MAEPKAKAKGAFPWVPVSIALAIGLLGAALAWKDPTGAVIGLERRWGDVLFRLRGEQPMHPKLQIVAVDDFSIGAIGPFPWKRGVHAQIVRKLHALGVKTIAFDVLFLDPRADDPKGDLELTKATKESGRVLHLFDISPVPGPEGTIQALYTWPALPGLKDGAALMAYPNVGANLDPDGVLRRVSLYDFSYDQPYPGLGSAMWVHFTGKSMNDLALAPDPMTMNARGPVELPTAVVQTSTAGVVHFVHAASLFAPREGDFGIVDISNLKVDMLTDAERAAFKDGVAVVAATAIGTFDHYPTPFDKLTPGVMVHATVFDNLMKGDWLRPAPRWAAPLAALLLAALAFVLAELGPVSGAFLSLGVLLGFAGFDLLLFMRTVRMEFVVPAATFAATFGVLQAQRILHEQRQKRWIKGTFGQYLSPKVVEIITADPSKLKLGGDRRDLSVFFLDIAHFTSISEKLTPEKLTEFLNEYLSALSDVILKNDGVIDKYIGDCVMAFWNAPVDQPRHRQLACLSAVECIEVVAKLNETYVDPALPEQPSVRIGLNAGEAVVGNMGSKSRLSYTVIGDEVNLASRLEGANKFFGSNIMASESVYKDAAGVVEARELGRIRVVGKEIPIRVFELLGRKGGLAGDEMKALAEYQEGLLRYHARRFEDAKASFTAAARLQPFDKVPRMYIRFCDLALAHPLPDDWEGVFNLTSK